MRDAKITDTGCYLSSSRGHYMPRDTINFAVEFGFIIGPFEKFAVDMYEDHDGDQDFPYEGMLELCDEAVTWLNSGQGKCSYCNGTGKAANGWIDKDGVSRCRMCTATGRGDRIEGQNFPPRIPEGTAWGNEDGDFGLWYYDDEGNVIDVPDSPTAA